MSLTPQDVERIVFRSLRTAYEKDRGSWTAPPDVIYVTEVTGCLLRSWYMRTMAGPISDEKIVILLLGDDVHYLINSQFPLGEGEKSFEREYKGVTIKGRVDRIAGELIFEFKTASNIPREPREHHVDQMQLYFWLAEKNKGFLVYVSKTTGQVKAFPIIRDEQRIQTLLERAESLSNSLRLAVPPAPEKGWLCEYCEFRDRCIGFREEGPP
ncbi:MAG: PD-(D/E)XK nuclease family protein [Infirmifilum uzonense]|uniref:PD-(D/E)XK nuclease family protein n=1 Tax=Infirmifilum uzonense TaxID=1550241 RepID=UPI003C722CDE